MQASSPDLLSHLPDLSESVACTTIQLRVAKEIIDKQWNAIQEERCRLVEEMERYTLDRETFEQERKAFEAERAWVQNNIVDDQVSLCVGGKFLATSRRTLVSSEGSMLSAMFSGRHKLARSAGILTTLATTNCPRWLYFPRPRS